MCSLSLCLKIIKSINITYKLTSTSLYSLLEDNKGWKLSSTWEDKTSGSSSGRWAACGPGPWSPQNLQSWEPRDKTSRGSAPGPLGVSVSLRTRSTSSTSSTTLTYIRAPSFSLTQKHSLLSHCDTILIWVFIIFVALLVLSRDPQHHQSLQDSLICCVININAQLSVRKHNVISFLHHFLLPLHHMMQHFFTLTLDIPAAVCQSVSAAAAAAASSSWINPASRSPSGGAPDLCD